MVALITILVVLSWFVIGAVTAWFGVWFRNILDLYSSDYMYSEGEIRVVIIFGYISFIVYFFWTLKIIVLDVVFHGFIKHLARKIKC